MRGHDASRARLGYLDQGAADPHGAADPLLLDEAMLMGLQHHVRPEPPGVEVPPGWSSASRSSVDVVTKCTTEESKNPPGRPRKVPSSFSMTRPFRSAVRRARARSARPSQAPTAPAAADRGVECLAGRELDVDLAAGRGAPGRQQTRDLLRAEDAAGSTSRRAQADPLRCPAGRATRDPNAPPASTSRGSAKGRRRVRRSRHHATSWVQALVAM